MSRCTLGNAAHCAGNADRRIDHRDVDALRVTMEIEADDVGLLVMGIGARRTAQDFQSQGYGSGGHRGSFSRGDRGGQCRTGPRIRMRIVYTTCVTYI